MQGLPPGHQTNSCSHVFRVTSQTDGKTQGSPITHQNENVIETYMTGGKKLDSPITLQGMRQNASHLATIIETTVIEERIGFPMMQQNIILNPDHLVTTIGILMGKRQDSPGTR